jgi:hypothetical protein
MTSKGVTARKAARADDNARVWLNKRRMTRAAVRECLQQVWEHIQSVYEGVAGDETAQLLLCVDAIHPSCHEDLILEVRHEGSRLDSHRLSLLVILLSSRDSMESTKHSQSSITKDYRSFFSF